MLSAALTLEAELATLSLARVSVSRSLFFTGHTTDGQATHEPPEKVLASLARTCEVTMREMLLTVPPLVAPLPLQERLLTNTPVTTTTTMTSSNPPLRV